MATVVHFALFPPSGGSGEPPAAGQGEGVWEESDRDEEDEADEELDSDRYFQEMRNVNTGITQNIENIENYLVSIKTLKETYMH